MRYDAFISYRHSELDMEIAKKVHKGLETYKIPGSVKRKTGKKKIARVFRDQEELPIGSDLGNNITSVLESSEWLIVICSPRLPQSYWCLTEIETFIKMHDRNHVLAVLVEGEPDESFPEILLKDENGNPVEPLAADVRGETKAERNKKFKTELIRLCAPLLGVTYDDLRQRHRERAMRKYTAIAGVAAAAGIAFGVYNAYNLARINENYQAKLENESKTLAKTSQSILDTGDRKTAALVAIKGLPVDNDRPFVADCEYALSNALGVYENGTEMTKDRLLTHNLKVQDYALNDDGTRVLSSDYLNYIYLWDAENGEQLFNLMPEFIDGKADEIKDLVYADGKSYVATVHGLRTYSDDGELISEIDYPDSCYGSKFSSDGSLGIYCTSDNLSIYDTEKGTAIFSLDESITVPHDGNDISLNYSSVSMVSNDNKYAAVLMSNILVDNSFIRIVNLETFEYKDIEIASKNVSKIYFSSDDKLNVLTYNGDDIYSFSSEKEFTLLCFDTDGNTLWTRPITSSASSYGTGYFNFHDRDYTDEEGLEHNELFLSLYRYIYTIDRNTGETVSCITVSDDIENYFVNPKSAYGYLGLYSGNIEFVNFTEGSLYSEQTIDIADTITDFKISGGKAFIKSQYSNNILVASFSSGTTADLLFKSDDFFSHSACAPSGDTAAFCYKTDGSKMDVRVYNIDDNSMIRSFTIDDDYLYAFFYYDDDTIVAYDSNCKLYFYSIKDDKLDCRVLKEDGFSSNVFISGDGQKFLMWNGGSFKVVDLASKKANVDVDIEFLYAMSGCMDYTGDYFYCTTTNYELFKVDLNDGSYEQILNDYLIDSCELSNDNTKLACICCDGMLRIFNVEDLSLINEISYYGNHFTGRVGFLNEEGTKLYIQGADYIIRILDLDTMEYLYTSDEQYNILNNAFLNEETNQLAIVNSIGMIMFDLNNYGIKSYISGGLFYIPEKELIISTANTSKVYKFHNYNYNELIELANETYPGAELSDEQKLIYNIE